MRALLAAVAVLAACGDDATGSVRQPIVGGSADAGALVDDVFLVSMVFDTGANTICSGTLVGSRSILTAAHCIDPVRQGAASVMVRVTNKPNIAMLMMSDLIAVTEYQLHPGWNPNDAASEYDVAMLLLSRAPTGIGPRALDRAPLTGFVGQPIQLVGYGRTSDGAGDSGTRRTVSATVTAVASRTFDFGTASAGICSGDSGGPSFFQGRVVGVHSQIPGSCGPGTDMRVDVNLAFIDGFLAAKDPPPPPPDAGIDAGPPDAGAPDAGPPDAGVEADAGPRDAGDAPDAGALPPDPIEGCHCAAGPLQLASAAALLVLFRRSRKPSPKPPQ